MNDPTPIPEWIATLVGRLTLEREALGRALSEAQRLAQERPPVE